MVVRHHVAMTVKVHALEIAIMPVTTHVLMTARQDALVIVKVRVPDRRQGRRHVHIV